MQWHIDNDDNLVSESFGKKNTRGVVIKATNVDPNEQRFKYFGYLVSDLAPLVFWHGGGLKTWGNSETCMSHLEYFLDNLTNTNATLKV